MRCTASRSLAVFVLVGCVGAPPVVDSGQTTTTYGNNDSGSGSSSSSSVGSSDDGDDPIEDTDDGDPDPDPDPSGSGPFDIPPGSGDLPDGAVCTDDVQCASGHCYVQPFLGGYCGECNEDADCSGGGCTPPNPFDATPSSCNMGEPGAGCESDAVCTDGLSCSTAFSLLDLIVIRSCGTCQFDDECGDDICAPVVDLPQWSGVRTCVAPGSQPQDTYCELDGSGNTVCASGICSTVDIMGLAEIGACGECNTNLDCMGGTCVPGEFLLDSASLSGSRCQ